MTVCVTFADLIFPSGVFSLWAQHAGKAFILHTMTAGLQSTHKHIFYTETFSVLWSIIKSKNKQIQFTDRWSLTFQLWRGHTYYKTVMCFYLCSETIWHYFFKRQGKSDFLAYQICMWLEKQGLAAHAFQWLVLFKMTGMFSSIHLLPSPHGNSSQLGGQTGHTQTHTCKNTSTSFSFSLLSSFISLPLSSVC